MPNHHSPHYYYGLKSSFTLGGLFRPYREGGITYSLVYQNFVQTRCDNGTKSYGVEYCYYDSGANSCTVIVSYEVKTHVVIQ